MNDLIVAPHPLTAAGRTEVRAAQVYQRECLADFVARHGVDLDAGGWLIEIGGAQVPPALWSRTRVRDGHIVVCRRVPQKEALRVVATIALVAFTFSAAPWALPALTGLSGFGLFAVQAGVYMAGTLLINKLLPPQSASQLRQHYDSATGSTYSLAGGRNRARPYEPLGLVFGVVKVVPDYAAQPFTWFAGDDQYQAVRLHAGIDCGAVDSLAIGPTPITSFSDVVVTRQGFPSGNDATAADWENVDTQAGATLTAPTAPGSWVTRTSSTNAVRLAVDLTAQLYDMQSDGSMRLATLAVDLERRLLPSGSWVPFTGLGTSTVTLQSKATKPVRRTVQSPELTAGQYEVRVRKATADVATTNAANALEWVALRTYQQQATAPSYPLVALRIRASGQINGVLDEVSWIASQQAIPVWNGSAFVNAVSRNPGAQYLRFARGVYDGAGKLLAGLGLPDDQIDIETIKAWTLHCATQGYVFDHWFDAQTSCYDVLQAIAAAGMGSVSFHPGRLSVVWLASGQPIEDVVGMGNIKAGTFSVEYATLASSDELEVSWFDRDNAWVARSLRLLAPGVTTPRETARLAPAGVTTEGAAVRAGRLAMAQNIYQRKSVSWEMDLEHMAFRRWSLVALSHDLTQWGYSGRLRGATNVSGTVTLQLDEAVPWNASATARKVGLRIPGETGYRLFDVATFSGETRTLTLVGSWPGGVPFPGDSAANPAYDTTWIYDFAATPGKRLRVTSIEPSADLSGAKVTAVPEPDEFWTYMASGTYTAPAAPAAGPAIVVGNVKVSQRRLAVNVGGGTELWLTFDVTGPFNSAQIWGAQWGDDFGLLGQTIVPRFGPWTVPNDGDYQIKIVPFDALGRSGAAVVYTHSVSLANESSGPRSLIDATWWLPGAAWQWLLIDDTAGESSIVWGTGPRGQQQPLWKCTAAGSAGTGPDGGWNVAAPGAKPANEFVVDPTLTYRFAVPVYVQSGTGSVYLGPPSNGVCNLNTSTLNSNPYFVAQAKGSLTAGRWYLMVGYVFPAGSTGMTNAGSGIYDMQTGALIAAGSNFCWPAGQDWSAMRAFQYYSSTGGIVLFAPPVVEVLDGYEAARITYIGTGQVGTGQMAPYAASDGTIVDSSTVTGSTGSPGASVRAVTLWGPTIATTADDVLDINVSGILDETFWSQAAIASVELWLTHAPTFGGTQTEFGTRRKYSSPVDVYTNHTYFDLGKQEQIAPGAVTQDYVLRVQITYRDAAGAAKQCAKDVQADAQWKVVQRKR